MRMRKRLKWHTKHKFLQSSYCIISFRDVVFSVKQVLLIILSTVIFMKIDYLFYINGHPHGPATGATTCQIYMRRFKDGDTITVEPWRSAGFPVIRDLMVDRSAYDKIMQAGGYVSVNTGGIPDANAIPIAKPIADEAMDAAACIGCGACVAACKNGSAMLFVSAKVSQLALLPQGQVEAARRAKAMLAKMDELGFGNCTNTRACEAECPKCVSISNIARLNREFLKAKLKD